MKLYSVVYTYIEKSGEYNAAKAKIVGVFSSEEEAINFTGIWLAQLNKQGLSMRRWSGKEVILWSERDKTQGFLTVETNEVLSSSLFS